jgi:hypothetical protein
MMSEKDLRRAFATYFLDMRAAQKADGAAVPNKREEWENFVKHHVEEGLVPADATAWSCPRSLDAELRK